MSYYDDWSDKADMMRDFSIDSKELKGCRIHVASYVYADYSGSAFVLFSRDGVLYEVNGGHCSCYGLEGQWEPEETTVEALKHRLENGYAFSSYFSDDFVKAIRRFCSRREA